MGSSHMHVATDFIAKMSVRDLKYIRKDLIDVLEETNLRICR